MKQDGLNSMKLQFWLFKHADNFDALKRYESWLHFRAVTKHGQRSDTLLVHFVAVWAFWVRLG